MEKFKVQGNYNPLDVTFLQKRVSHLRLQKGRYISAIFAADIYDIYQALSTEIQKHTHSPIEKVIPNLWVMPDNMIDCCLRCIEEILQGLIAKQQLQQQQSQQDQSQMLNELKDIAQDFYGLYLYIRYSINPQEFKVLS